MMAKFKTSIISIIYLIFALSLAILLTIIVSPILYRFFIETFNLSAISGLGAQALEDNYQYIIEYLLSWSNQAFSMPYFSSSQSGIVHFEEVRNLVRINNLVLVISLLVTIYCLRLTQKRRWKYRMQANFPYLYAFPILILIVIILAFDQFFIFFHQILFNNDLWIFNPLYDPVIEVLPQELFMALFVLAILIYELVILFLKIFNKNLY